MISASLRCFAVIALAVSFASCGILNSQAEIAPGDYFCTDSTDVHLGPSSSAKVTNVQHRSDRVRVEEVVGEWARISPWYEASSEGQSGIVARWIRASSLSVVQPSPIPQPLIKPDARVEGIPAVGDAGLTERDVLILHAAARYFLESGAAKRVEYGDKSVDRKGVYYLNFGGPSNRFFKPDDIPNLEARIANLH